MNGASPSPTSWPYERFSRTMSHTRRGPMPVGDAPLSVDDPAVGLPPKVGSVKDGNASPVPRRTSTAMPTSTARAERTTRPPSNRRRDESIARKGYRQDRPRSGLALWRPRCGDELVELPMGHHSLECTVRAEVTDL